MEWPGYDKDELFGFHKVINEPDFLPLHFVRVLTQAAKLFRTHHGKLVATPLGRKILKGEQYGPLQALLFHVALWRLNLGYFDRYAIDTWPQNEVGVVLWSLSASAHDWLARETLTRLCANSVIGILKSEWDFGSSAMEARILRPLWWFGLLEARSQEKSPTELVAHRLYRKAPCVIVFCNSMFRSRDQIFGIRGAASYPSATGPDHEMERTAILCSAKQPSDLAEIALLNTVEVHCSLRVGAPRHSDCHRYNETFLFISSPDKCIYEVRQRINPGLGSRFSPDLAPDLSNAANDLCPPFLPH
jgi:hypothetical protein